MKTSKSLLKKLSQLFTIVFFQTLVMHYSVFAQSELWGMTYQGGADDLGVIFKTDASGTSQVVQKKFISEYSGASPKYTHLTLASNGKLYGMTSLGGENNLGVLFEYNPGTGAYSKQLDFNGAANGSNPYGSLVQSTINGKLYGTAGGGASNKGVLFECIPGGPCLKRFDFNGTAGGGPVGALAQAPNGKLYGMTVDGGSYSAGVIFEYDAGPGVYIKKFDFNNNVGWTDGAYPLGGSLTLASNGKLYGMTSQGGSNRLGVLFEFNPSTGVFVKKIDFNGTINGSFPRGSLILATNGKMYGMTEQGGSNGWGVLFEYDPVTNVFIKKFDFSSSIGGAPTGSLFQASNGKLYGVTPQGGANAFGTLFEYDLSSGICLKKFDFDWGSAANGAYPGGSLTQFTNGKLYGMAEYGGANLVGVLFEYDPVTGIFVKKLDFSDANNGSKPTGSLMQASNGKLYGMTMKGGSNRLGVLFEYDRATGVYTKKVDFTGPNGSNPLGEVIQATNGKLYGTTNLGGASAVGVLFEYDPGTGIYTKKLDFNGTGNGANPVGSLVQAPNGKLYGTAQSGGANSNGVLFEYDPVTGTYSKKLDFTLSSTGKAPSGGLALASNGKLYGTTREGGSSFSGVLFEYDPNSGAYVKKLDFTGIANGRFPTGKLTLASNNKLYGVTSNGGASNAYGVLFEYDPIADVFSKKLDFNYSNGAYANNNGLVQSSNGKLYGMTLSGGANSLGVLYEYDPSTGVYTKKLDFNGTNGAQPRGQLISISTANPGARTNGDNSKKEEASQEITTSTQEQFKVNVFTNPFSERLRVSILTPETSNVSIKLVDLNGRIRYESLEETNSVIEIDKQLQQGVYILHAQSGSHLKAVRVMKID